jgi:hypothetical protein
MSDAADTARPVTGSGGTRASVAHSTGIASWAYRSAWMMAGSASLIVGAIGIVVPVLPTTPFVLLSAACYARASPRMLGLLERAPLVGPALVDWRRFRGITRRTRMLALGILAATISVSFVSLGGRPFVQFVLLVLGSLGGVCVAKLPSRNPDGADSALGAPSP